MTPEVKFKQRINGNLPILVYFYTAKNASCRLMQTILKIVDYRLKGSIKVIVIDIDARFNQPIIDQYLPTQSPVLMLFKQGELIWQKAGILSSRQLIGLVEHKLRQSVRIN